MTGKNIFFTQSLLSWNTKANTRQMPWKAEKDPYRIWLSEIILQQTRVEQGLPYYLRFIEKYPTIRDLALANNTDVFKLWEGLGYYSRCHSLIATAQYIYKECNSVFPKTYFEIASLKGIGPYTAAAIASFAYNLPYAVVDGNVIRVLSRFFGIDLLVDSAEGKKIISALASKLLDQNQPAVYNQAIMNFGAEVCKPKKPLCNICPLALKCTALKLGRTLELPLKKPKKERKIRYFHYLVLIQNHAVFIRERSTKDVWQHLHEFFLLETDKLLPAKTVFGKYAKNLPKGISYSDMQSSSVDFVQQLTHQSIHTRFIIVKPSKKIDLPGYQLVPLTTIAQYAFPKTIVKWLELNPFNSR